MKNFTTSFIDISELQTSLHNNNIIRDTSTTLIQIFFADINIDSIKKIQLFFKNKYPNSTVLGTTTDGVLEGTKVYNDTKSVVTFTSFEETILNTVLLEYKDYDHDSYTIGCAIATKLCSNNTKVIICFADGIHTNGEEYLNGINSIDSSVIVSGGLSADNGNLKKTYVFDKEKIVSNGVIGVSLNNKNLSVTTNYSFDWMPIGKKMRVSKSVANRVYEIDGMSAVDIYAKYMGIELAKQLPQTGIEFPLIFQEDDVSVGRAVLFKHDDGSLTFAGNIKQGTLVQFGVGNIDRILNNSEQQVSSFFKKLQYRPEAIFVYSCMARRRFMKEYIEDDLKIIGNIGELSGFFTYGEFYSSNNTNKLLNETMTVLALSENKQKLEFNCFNNSKTNHTHTLNKEQVIANLANAVSNELAELNQNLEVRVKKSASNIYKRAYYDKLTGLPNRLSLIKRLNETSNKVLFLINIDNFTMINDFYGYDNGDLILKRFSIVLENLDSKKTLEIFKLHSDEFAIILEMQNDYDEIEERLKRLIFNVESDEFVIDGNIIHISITASASYIDVNNNALRDAEISLKMAKKRFENFIIHNKGFQEESKNKNNIKMANIIKNAINSDNIIPYYQPIFDTKTGTIEKYESLVRLRKDDGEILSPFFFLEISQKIKLYPSITKIMIEKVFSNFKNNGLNFSINIAFSDILNHNTRAYIFNKIDEYNIANQLTIEILETQEIENEESIFYFIDEVYKRGAKIAIDDFGSGFANFKHITTIRSDYMKIDGSLIKDMNTDSDARLVVETIIVFAKKLKKKTVAEFVHSKEIYDIVKELDIDYIQGYYLGEPKGTVV